ncbi:MAG TPA: hypothetical protein VLU25_16195 [Acidobacteriota bacterium]|nr:hypothetical protein [Acidobacteriota bacterium]
MHFHRHHSQAFHEKVKLTPTASLRSHLAALYEKSMQLNADNQNAVQKPEDLQR